MNKEEKEEKTKDEGCLPVGTILNSRWKLARLLGRGAFGKAFLLLVLVPLPVMCYLLLRSLLGHIFISKKVSRDKPDYPVCSLSLSLPLSLSLSPLVCSDCFHSKMTPYCCCFFAVLLLETSCN
jgi:hypothetical protein